MPKGSPRPAAPTDPVEFYEWLWDYINVGPHGCWLWQGSLTEKGYSRVRGTLLTGGRKIYGHIWVYERLVGPIPPGRELDHLCEVRRCVNPAHLEPVTHAVNIQRSLTQTHCREGHPLSGENLRVLLDGERTCILCARRRSRDHARRKRAADPGFRERQRQASALRRATDPEFRERQRLACAARRAKNRGRQHDPGDRPG
jgi:hypothetical protein